MFRREFLKLVGIMPIVTSTLSIVEQKPQWIRLTEQQPRIEQKIILLAYHDHYRNYYGIGGGILKELDMGMSDKNHTAIISIAVDFIKYNGGSFLEHGAASKEGEKVIKSRKWLIPEKNSKFKIYRNSYQWKIHTRSYYLTHYHWLPVDGEYPIDIPPIPNPEIKSE